MPRAAGESMAVSSTYLREAEGLAQALGDQHRLGWVSAYMSSMFWATGDLRRAVEPASAPSPWPRPWGMRPSRS